VWSGRRWRSIKIFWVKTCINSRNKKGNQLLAANKRRKVSEQATAARSTPTAGGYQLDSSFLNLWT